MNINPTYIHAEIEKCIDGSIYINKFAMQHSRVRE